MRGEKILRMEYRMPRIKADETYPGDSGCNFAVKIDVLLQNLEPNGNDGSEAIQSRQLSLGAQCMSLSNVP